MKTIFKSVFQITIFSCLCISCSSPNSEASKEIVQTCFPEQFNSDLNKLIDSFDQFIKRNYDGKIENFIEPILNRIYPNTTEFNASDIKLVKEINEHYFKDNIYTVIDESYESLGVQVPKTASADKLKVRKKTIVDPEKPYLNCISRLDIKDEFIEGYLKIYANNPGVSSIPVSKLFLKTKDNKDFNLKIAKRVIAVELYYSILTTVAVNR